MVNIEGLSKPSVLKALYDNSKVQGMGFLQATGEPLTEYEAKCLLKEDTYFDYLHGKIMKIHLDNDVEFDERLYDRDNGEGAAQKAIDKLREMNSKFKFDKETGDRVMQLAPTSEFDKTDNRTVFNVDNVVCRLSEIFNVNIGYSAFSSGDIDFINKDNGHILFSFSRDSDGIVTEVYTAISILSLETMFAEFQQLQGYIGTKVEVD